MSDWNSRAEGRAYRINKNIRDIARADRNNWARSGRTNRRALKKWITQAYLSFNSEGGSEKHRVMIYVHIRLGEAVRDRTMKASRADWLLDENHKDDLAIWVAQTAAAEEDKVIRTQEGFRTFDRARKELNKALDRFTTGRVSEYDAGRALSAVLDRADIRAIANQTFAAPGATTEEMEAWQASLAEARHKVSQWKQSARYRREQQAKVRAGLVQSASGSAEEQSDPEADLFSALSSVRHSPSGVSRLALQKALTRAVRLGAGDTARANEARIVLGMSTGSRGSEQVRELPWNWIGVGGLVVLGGLVAVGVTGSR